MARHELATLDRLDIFHGDLDYVDETLWHDHRGYYLKSDYGYYGDPREEWESFTHGKRGVTRLTESQARRWWIESAMMDRTTPDAKGFVYRGSLKFREIEGAPFPAEWAQAAEKAIADREAEAIAEFCMCRVDDE